MVSSPSIKRSHKQSVSLSYLPDDLLVDISLRVAGSSLSDIHNLEQVSKSFQIHCNDPYILHRVSLHQLPLFPWTQNHENLRRFSKIFKRFRKNGNPEALYRKGIVNYFHRNSNEQKQNRGLKQIAEAANKGNQQAQYVYGLILICLGGKTKQKGFKILSSFIKPLMSHTMKDMGKLRYNISEYIFWNCQLMMRQLQRNYTRESCNCNGRTEMILVKNYGWEPYGENKITSSICEICFCHHEVQLFFNY